MSEDVMSQLTFLLCDESLPEAFAANCVAVAAQLLLHPGEGLPIEASGPPVKPRAIAGAKKSLLAALVGWSASYVHGPRLLASLALCEILERCELETPGWYLESLQKHVLRGQAFSKLRSKVRVDDWVSACWSARKPSRPLDFSLGLATKQVATEFWSPPDCDLPEGAEDASIQRRPEKPGLLDASPCTKVVICASLVDNVPNMAGLVRTAEALIGSQAEVALRCDKVLQDPHFQKVVVAADRGLRISAVPPGPRLLAYLKDLRSSGLEVLALEQTSGSTLLSASTVLPARFVLLLGGEQEGLPPWLLHSGLVDRCLELPLRGRTGSLNVHVAAAMLLWHYRLQH